MQVQTFNSLKLVQLVRKRGKSRRVQKLSSKASALLGVRENKTTSDMLMESSRTVHVCVRTKHRKRVFKASGSETNTDCALDFTESASHKPKKGKDELHVFLFYTLDQNGFM